VKELPDNPRMLAFVALCHPDEMVRKVAAVELANASDHKAQDFVPLQFHSQVAV
jgi:hypothetical protein